MKTLTRSGWLILLDDEDVTKITTFESEWSSHFVVDPNNHVHCCVGPNRIAVTLSHLLVNCPTGLVVDHINGNSLDNQKANLRVTTQQENCQNRTRKNRNNRLGVLGVFFNGPTRKFIAHVRRDNKYINLGSFGTLDEAKNARELFIKKEKNVLLTK